ncbi:MAG: energy transducer TonB [Ignavibacterium sp.]|nr:energy transducer TonB [Ignavibacterium sp.]MDW8374627.1 energy transducer TonB [Ignavibacteriales bacterium]
MRLIAIFFLILIYSVIINAQSSNDSEDGYLAFAEVMPEPVNGMAELIKQVKYPEIAKKAGLEGKVFAMAYIDEKGSVTDVKIIKGIGGGCDEEVVSVLKKAKFKPGQNKGTNVKVKMSIPFVFKLK